MRFPEFTEEWKAEQLDNIATLSKGIGISKEQLSEDGEPCILYGELYTKYKSEIIKQVESKTDINGSKLKRSKANDVIIPCSGETAVDIATARCVPFDNILFGGDLNVISLHQYDGAFMSYQLNGKRKYDIARVAQGVSIVHLYGEHLKAIKTYNPTLPEQQKIAKLLSLLDDRIDTQNKIIEDLKKLKSAIRKKMFSLLKDEYTESFEINQLLDYEQPTAYIVANDEYSTDTSLTPVLTANKGFILGYTDEKFGIYQKGECIIFDDFTMDAKYVSFPFKVKSSAIKILTAKPNVNLRFMFEYLSYWELKSEEHKRHYISEIASLVIELPSKERQSIIASLMTSLNSKLDIEAKTKIRYEEQKRYLLSQMFI
ncbi:restriction endonuclease subunit S [Bacteroides uniformis]|uniref:restriction endonuclease subunit S n=1 Tax=Bacteroidales TaxID=171549 RepID=UPI00189A816B|nr:MULTISPECIES: restriction endonuclease subunit S [Bacteroidales]MBV3628540.1 restriction endonuclease subunit S [Bacteroides uniformis]MBV3643916.1 restriction endonuclease subunit S [Bacteroides uniformis]MBV3651921.1 restriction endonuclease subunit S [Bacteroides uniformis]MBV3688873.1 restriction endonuclease subunit S [Bacteroides uniformis]MBV3716158.1 restriction endonuclease subunit S [Bacteroides uniformis]